MSSKVDNATKATIRLVNELGADILVTKRTIPPLSTFERRKLRHRVEEAALDHHQERQGTTHQCITLCFDHEPIMPLWSPVTMERTGRIAVVGPSPTVEAVLKGELGWSRSERVLADALRRSGLGLDQITWLNVCWCWPALDGGESYQRGTKVVKTSRSPNAQETALWHPFLMQALEAADVDYVLLHGGHAKSAWRPDLTIEQVGSGMHLWKNRWMVTAVNHVSAVMRKDSVISEQKWRVRIGRFAEAVHDGRGLESLPVACVKCYHPLFGYDPDGVPYCSEHFAQGVKGREKAMKREQKRRTQGQGVLL